MQLCMLLRIQACLYKFLNLRLRSFVYTLEKVSAVPNKLLLPTSTHSNHLEDLVKELVNLLPQSF